MLLAGYGVWVMKVTIPTIAKSVEREAVPPQRKSCFLQGLILSAEQQLNAVYASRPFGHSTIF